MDKKQPAEAVTMGGPKSEEEELKAALIELALTKAELEQAKEAAVESWLDSNPLIDELEKLQTEIAKANRRVSQATVAILKMESELEAMDASIKAKQEEETNARRGTEEVRRCLDQTQEEMAKLQAEADEERLARNRLRHGYRLKRQSLRVLQLVHRAVRMESEAVGASTADAIRYIEHAKADNSVIVLSTEEYNEVERKASEKTADAEWRISVSIERREVAEKSRQSALRRLNEVKTERNRKRARKMTEIVEESQFPRQEQPAIHQVRPSSPPPQAMKGEEFTRQNRNPNQRSTITRSRSRNKKMVKKLSILHQIRHFLLRCIRKLFR